MLFYVLWNILRCAQWSLKWYPFFDYFMFINNQNVLQTKYIHKILNNYIIVQVYVSIYCISLCRPIYFSLWSQCLQTKHLNNLTENVLTWVGEKGNFIYSDRHSAINPNVNEFRIIHQNEGVLAYSVLGLRGGGEMQFIYYT